MLFMNMVAQAQRNGELDLEKFTKSGLEMLNPQAELEQEPNMPSGHLASLFDAQGPNLNCLTACAASSQAIGEATEIIRRGDADAMLSGGAHSMIHPFGVTGFNLLTALSTNNDDPQTGPRGRSTRIATVSFSVKARAWWCWKNSTHAKARRSKDLRRNGRVRLDRRRVPHHRHSSRRARRGRLHQNGTQRRAAQSRRASTTSTPTAPARS